MLSGRRIETRVDTQASPTQLSYSWFKVSSLSDANKLCVLDIVGVSCAISLDLSHLFSDLW